MDSSYKCGGLYPKYHSWGADVVQAFCDRYCDEV